MVVGVVAERGREAGRLRVVDLDPHGPAVLVDGHGPQQRAVLDSQVFQRAQRLTGGPTQLGVVPLGLQLG
jgi:hypothetical protein